MKPIQLHHTSINVTDLERSREFYERLLGLARLERPDLGVPGAWYGIGAGQVHLIQCQPAGGRIDPSGPHFAIEVADLDEARRRLTAQGIEMLDPGLNQLWIRDPDGNVVEITVRTR